MGLVINQPADISYNELFKQLKLSESYDDNSPLLAGGPVQKERGFVLHSDDYYVDEATLEVDEGISMPATLDILKAIAVGEGPERMMIALGYAGWAGGQLEGELQRNGWLTCDADEDIVFGRANDEKWEAALAKLGVDPRMLSAEGGTA